MRIGLDYSAGLYQGSGIGRYARGLVHALADASPRHDYTLLWARAYDSGGRELPRLDRLDQLPGHVRARRLPVQNRLMTAMWHRLRLPLPVEAFAGRLDLFHAPDFVAPPTLRARRFITVHDLTFLVVPELAHPKLAAYLRSAVPRAVRSADHIFADSEATSSDLQRLLDVPAAKISVVYVGREAMFRPFQAAERAAARVALGAAGVPPGPYILSVGTIEPRKNHVGLLEAYAQVVRAGAPHRLIIAGKRGWLDEPVFATISRLDLGDRVVLLNFVPDEILPALYNQADLLVQPSFYEGFGIPVLEAMACGTPTMISSRPSLPEIAGGAAAVVEPDDPPALAAAIRDLLGDAERLGALRQLGLRRAAAFNWSDSAATVLARYHAIG